MSPKSVLVFVAVVVFLVVVGGVFISEIKDDFSNTNQLVNHRILSDSYDFPECARSRESFFSSNFSKID